MTNIGDIMRSKLIESNGNGEERSQQRQWSSYQLREEQKEAWVQDLDGGDHL